MIPIIASLVSMFASKGLDMLANTAESVTDKGFEKLAEFVKEKTGIDIKKKATEPELTPEEIQKLKELEIQHKEELERIALEYYKLDLQDRADARKMQIEALRQEDKFAKRFVYYFAGVAMTLSFTYIFLITFVEIPASNIRFADTILGVVIGTLISTITQFFFGSSHGSKDKDNILKDALNKKSPNAK